MAPRRWLLFGLAIASLVILTWGAVVYAYSIPISRAEGEAYPSLTEGARAVVVPFTNPREIATLAEGKEPTLLATTTAKGSFPATAKDARLAQALAYASHGVTGYVPAEIEFQNLSTVNGTRNFTIYVGELAGGENGFIVIGPEDEAPRFVAQADILGRIERAESTTGLIALMIAGAFGFISPLLAIIFTNKARAPPATASSATSTTFCRECKAPLGAEERFCVRCGAYRGNP